MLLLSAASWSGVRSRSALFKRSTLHIRATPPKAIRVKTTNINGLCLGRSVEKKTSDTTPANPKTIKPSLTPWRTERSAPERNGIGWGYDGGSGLICTEVD
jgi:hypothetical protein